MNQKEYNQTPMGKYIRQRANANWRGIPWQFTFETWWKIWEKSGKWEQRGRNPGQYYMCRKSDTGPYSPGNVRIATISENALESWQVRKYQPISDSFEPYPRTSAWDYPHSHLDKWREQHISKASTEST